jgi:hypothetical protein
LCAPVRSKESITPYQKRGSRGYEYPTNGEERRGRKVERGILGTPKSRILCLHFERFPIWLLALTENQVSRLCIMGFATQNEFLEFGSTMQFDSGLLKAALTNIGESKIVYSNAIKRPDDALYLVSGSRAYTQAWSQQVTKPMLVLCDEHIRAKNRLFCRGSLRWMSLRHYTLGG